MSAEDIAKWLDEKPEDKLQLQGTKVEDIESFLAKKEPEFEKEKTVSEDWYQPITEMATGFNDALLNTLNVPNSMFNWASEKLGSDRRISSIRNLTADFGVGTKEGQELDTGAYKAGEYASMGLQFLAPILHLGKAAPLLANPSTAIGVAQTMTKPFAAMPKTAYGTELAAGVTSGYGAHYGGKEWGVLGEQVGGLAAGIAPVALASTLNRSADYLVKSIIPFTDKGGRAKAGSVIRQLRESPDFTDEIIRQEKMSLSETRHTPARLSKEPFLIALEKALIHDDPELAHILRNVDAENNALAKTAMKLLGGNGAIENSIKSLGSTYTKLKTRLDLKVDSSLVKAKDAVSKLEPLSQRKAVNIEVRKQIGDSLSAARDAENKLWAQVDRKAIAPTRNTKEAFTNVLKQRELESDPTDIPPFLHEFLGSFKDGALKGGKYGDTRPVGGLQQLRSRLLQTVRQEKGGETPNWNRVRVLEQIDEAILKDMADSDAAHGLGEALNFSRELNQKFKGDIMSIILRNNKTGGSLAPELTLDALGSGEKGAYYIKRILDASPESKQGIEDVLKMDIVQQKIVKDGILNIQKAKDYMLKNKSSMAMFPALKDNMENAVLLAETHKYFDGSAVVRMKKAENALGFSLADKTNPGRFISKIMSSKHPEKTMQRVMRQVNAEGQAGIKSDVVDLIIQKSRTSELGADETAMLSGKKALGFWNENKKVLSNALTKEEQTRLERILNDLRLGDDPKDIPIDIAKAALAPKKTMLGYAVEVAAARMGATLGRQTSGASLKTASQAANTARSIMGGLDVGMATKLLKDAVQDKELYLALAETPAHLLKNNRRFSAIQSWMLTHTLSSLETETDIQD